MKKTLLVWGLLLAACGGREAQWDAPLGTGKSHGLVGAVALEDPWLQRLLLVTSPEPYRLAVTPLPVGKNVVTVQHSPDRKRLFVLSRGEQPRFRPGDERPRLTVIEGGTEPRIEREFELDDPLVNLAIDPRGEWIAAYDVDGTVVNPNELVLLSLDASGDVRSKTIRSFGGSPLELLFTDELTLPSGVRRFLIVRTDRDITLVDLSDLDRSEITVQLPELERGQSSRPEEVVFDAGDPDESTSARLAVRLGGQRDVVLLEFGSSQAREFVITPNIVDVGGVPSAIDFVRTDGGLRLAALVPGARRATLVDPTTTATEVVDFPAPYSRMRRITDELGSAPVSGDVALLWSESARGIAFWSLGQTSGTPYRSVDSNDIQLAVREVTDVPAPNQHLKLLSGSGAERFYVLDLNRRQTFPMLTRSQGFEANVAADGGRLWAFRRGSGEFSSVELEDLHPTSLSVRIGISQIYDIERDDGSRAALVLHGSDGTTGSASVTLFDAIAPDSADTRYFGGLYSEGF